MFLKNKNILITAGPTWVPIDSVRVISNIATGRTGILLAEELQRSGASVTLFLGAVESCCLNKKIRLIRFKYFDELRNLIKRELRLKDYNLIVHSAAVSDFRPKRNIKGKLDSHKAHSLELISLPKIIKDIRRLATRAKLVMFKFELGVSDTALIQKAKKAQVEANADFIVANTIDPYRAFVIDRAEKIVSARSKKELVGKLLRAIHL